MPNHTFQGPGTLVEIDSIHKERGNGPKNRERSGKTGKRARIYKIDGSNTKVYEYPLVRGATYKEVCQKLRPVLQGLNIPHAVVINRNGVTFIPPA